LAWRSTYCRRAQCITETVVAHISKVRGVPARPQDNKPSRGARNPGHFAKEGCAGHSYARLDARHSLRLG